MKRALRYEPLDEIRPADVNAKAHADADIAASIDRFGFLLPLVRDERTGQLVAGHGRLADLVRRADAGEEPPEGIIVERGRWLVPIATGWASTNDDDAHAAAVSLNQIETAGGWRTDELYALLDDLADSPRGLDGTGYTADSLDSMLAEMSRDANRFGGGDSPARSDVSIGAKAQTYKTNGVRSLVLDYNLAEYERLQQALGRLRKARDAETNAVLIRQLLEEA